MTGLDHTPGHADAWAFRWLITRGVYLGRYVVTIAAGDFVENIPAVVDDFGNLVRVEQ